MVCHMRKDATLTYAWENKTVGVRAFFCNLSRSNCGAVFSPFIIHNLHSDTCPFISQQKLWIQPVRNNEDGRSIISCIGIWQINRDHISYQELTCKTNNFILQRNMEFSFCLFQTSELIETNPVVSSILINISVFVICCKLSATSNTDPSSLSPSQLMTVSVWI